MRRGGHDRHLAVAAACCAALDAECGALAGLADAGDHLAAQVGAHRLAHAHGGRGLALAQWSRRDTCHHHCKKAHFALEKIAHSSMSCIEWSWPGLATWQVATLRLT